MEATSNASSNLDGSSELSKEHVVVFVLGGPGSGKGTLCSKIAESFGFCNLSVGELLGKESESGSEEKDMIDACKMEGTLVPTELVIKILQRAMEVSKIKKFLIDGFPRNEENRLAAESKKLEPDLVLYLECSEETMMKRILNRNQGRADDNETTATKRVKVFLECSVPIVNYYDSLGKVVKINGEQTKEEVFEAVKGAFSKFKMDSN